MTEIEIVRFIVLVIAFILLGCYQKYQIGILRKDLESQRSILKSVERFFNIFDLDKIEKYVEISEKLSKKETEQAIAEMQERLKKETEQIKASKENSGNELSQLLLLFADVSTYLPKYVIKTEIEKRSRTGMMVAIWEALKLDEVSSEPQGGLLDPFLYNAIIAQGLTPKSKRIGKLARERLAQGSTRKTEELGPLTQDALTPPDQKK